MAAAALKLGKQKGEEMGLPCEKDTDDRSAQINHESKGATQDSGEVLDSSEPQNMMQLEMQMPRHTPSSEGPPGVDQEDPVNTEGNQKKQGPKAKTPGRRKRKEIVPQTPPQHDNSAVSDTSELTSSGRPKRRAAKVALDYLYNLAKDLDPPSESSLKDTAKSDEVDGTDKKTPRKRGVKRKIPDHESDSDDDEDFSPGENEEAESEDEEDDSDPDVSLNVECRGSKPSSGRPRGNYQGPHPSGLAKNVMETIWNCFSRTKKFRDENFSPWVFPEWIPSAKDWHFLSSSEAEKYLPQEKESASFTFTRESIKGQIKLQTVKRFESLPHHSERWDALFFVGGPVRSLEWCPCPDGAATRQYAAIYCHKGMDDEHKINKLHTGPVLLQLWEIGDLECKSRPSTAPRLAYALAIDDGCIWNIRWCPAGVWELPSTSRKAPQMARLGVLAAAFSNGSIGVYSLPHPEALAAHHQSKGETSQAPLICRVKKVLTLKMGSSQADHKGQSGLCFAMDWVHVKPHNLLAAGFYDGLVGLWDLVSKSMLLKVRSPDGGVSLYPYHCFHAHDENIRTLCWCRASSNLLVTVGDDRMAKMWDVRKTYAPLLAVKRCLSPEVNWPLFWSGILMAPECCFATFGQHGVHYFDSGYIGIKPYFVVSRKPTIWSLSMSDWINTFAIADNGGDCLFSLLPEMDTDPSCIRRRRYSVYRTDMIQFEPGQRPGDEKQEEEEVENAASNPRKEPLSYKGAIRKYYLHFHDLDLGTFAKSETRPMMKHLHHHEVKGVAKVDQMPLSALYKVRFNPNMDAYNWILSGGQSGLVRVNCARGLSSSLMLKQLRQAQAQFSAMFQS
ncbi:general transcription factor 3C polypeptide 2-like isoform X1 [Carassius auratus]|uniref:General transcription factor 3C polypeptide 2-like isoform X1 n=1 Tax=Carassius auratus TaxID=7957 RepID=A0A6P6KDR9_CARAU|nr:general transcription factor 3C polypeptide 2-like isoform X1 [Carassius auratus]